MLYSNVKSVSQNISDAEWEYKKKKWDDESQQQQPTLRSMILFNLYISCPLIGP